jgi:hypothetical protein
MAARIDWPRLLSQHRIPFVDSGPNVKRGNLNIRCPFCGSADPSHHMGIDPDNNQWACWRNKDHRGASPVRLVMKLLRVGYERACEICGVGPDYVDPDDFSTVRDRLFKKRDERVEQKKELNLLSDFREIHDSGLTRRFWNYLYDRKFDNIDELTRYYGLKCALMGEFSGRIILPIYVDGELVSWTSRSIGSSNMRYKDLDLDRSIIRPKDSLYNYDRAMEGGEVLVLVEGPFDVLKLDFYGKRFGVRAVGLFTNSLSEKQTYLLVNLIRKFKRVIIMMDTEDQVHIVHSMRMAGNIPQAAPEFQPIPFGYKDFGELTPGRVFAFCKSLREVA